MQKNASHLPLASTTEFCVAEESLARRRPWAPDTEVLCQASKEHYPLPLRPWPSGDN